MAHNARGRLAVDIMLVTSKITIEGTTLEPGDFLVSDGRRTWGMSRAEALEDIQPSSALARKLLSNGDGDEEGEDEDKKPAKQTTLLSDHAA